MRDNFHKLFVFAHRNNKQIGGHEYSFFFKTQYLKHLPTLQAISTQARLKGYNMVISKGVVVYGGDDITADVQKVVK